MIYIIYIVLDFEVLDTQYAIWYWSNIDDISNIADTIRPLLQSRYHKWLADIHTDSDILNLPFVIKQCGLLKVDIQVCRYKLISYNKRNKLDSFVLKLTFSEGIC